MATDGGGLVGFFSQALAAFVGTGLAVVALRALSGTLLGHWLAKGLVRYTADVETQQHAKRVAISRLDAERSRFIDGFMEAASKCNHLMSMPVDLKHLPSGAGPELAFILLYGQIVTAVQSMHQEVLANSHRFRTDEQLPQLMLLWLGEVRQAADRYYDWLKAVLSQESFFAMNEGDRGRWLMVEKQSRLLMPADSFRALHERSRAITTGAD